MSKSLRFPVKEACPFCELLADGSADLICANDLAASFADSFPLNPGHALIVPRRHEPNPFALTPAEQASLWALLDPTRAAIAAGHDADGWNVGVNVGIAGGQTIPHVHVHLIPRLVGDSDPAGDGSFDPRGGVRWVVRERAAYWRD